ncbi:MAG: hypothetical protein SGARI_004682, partial [Bacillariaceae sp.]
MTGTVEADTFEEDGSFVHSDNNSLHGDSFNQDSARDFHQSEVESGGGSSDNNTTSLRDDDDDGGVHMKFKSHTLPSLSTQFHQFALTLEDATEFHIKGVLQATQGLSEILTAEAITTNSTWPFVTLSNFEVYVGNTRAQASSELIAVAPIVSKENLPKWNEYSNEHQGWIDESFAVYGERVDFSPIPSSCYRFGRFKGRTVLVAENGEGDYPAAPFWTMSRPPFDTSIVNFNALSTVPYQKAYDTMTATRKFAFGEAGANDLIGYTMGLEEHDELHGFTQKYGANATSEVGFANDHPHTPIEYPVFQNMNEDGPIVAIVVNVIPWDNYFKGALPEGVNGIFAVLHNSLGQDFTYMINGNDATYIGAGDRHDPAYEAFEFIIDVNAL